MKNISFFHEKNEYSLNDLVFIKKPITDNTILALQEKFLTNGLHHITVPTIHDGRTLVFTFLHSLSFVLHTVACVTTSDRALPDTIIDIHAQLTTHENFDLINTGYMQDFLFEQFYCDFIWVELTPSLVSSRWYSDFEKNFLDLNMDKNIPMLVITYENDCNLKSNLL